MGRSKPADGSCQRQPIFLSLFVLSYQSPTKQLLFVCLLRAHKLAQLNFAATPAYSTVRTKLLFCPQASFFFFTRPLSGLLLGLRLPLTLCPILLTLAAQTFQWRNNFVLFSTFQ